MARLLTVVLDLDTLPAAISASALACFFAHRNGRIPGAHVADIDPDDLEALCRELGRNIAQVVVMSDARQEDIEP